MSGVRGGQLRASLPPNQLIADIKHCLERVDVAISLPKNRDFALYTIFATSLLAALKICLFTVVAVLTHCLSAQRLCFLAASSSSLTSRYQGSSLPARTRRRRKGACFSSKDWSLLLKSSIEGHSSGETSMHKSSRMQLYVSHVCCEILCTQQGQGEQQHAAHKQHRSDQKRLTE